jgi:hypothetical protein
MIVKDMNDLSNFMLELAAKEMLQRNSAGNMKERDQCMARAATWELAADLVRHVEFKKDAKK